MTEARPALRIRELAITNYRTFRERTVIPFSGAGGAADAIATFHGDNGAGKSNAVDALDLFFKAAITILTSSHTDDWTLAWDVERKTAFASFVVSYRDRPAGAAGPTEIEVRFEDDRLGSMRLRFTPSGEGVFVQLDRAAGGGAEPLPASHTGQLLTWVQTPFGPGSRPLAVLDPRRRARWLRAPARASLLPEGLAEDLFAFRTALRPDLRERWRRFTKLLERFETFRGKDVSIERIDPKGSPELILEEHARSVLSFSELSSGEQQIVVLCAAILLSNAAILVIEEPEISLDFKNQSLFQAILQEAVEAGLVDQIVLESHVPSFDGPDVIRFRRDEHSSTAVERVPSATVNAAELARKAEQQGAKQRWVTRDGYTQLPEAMREDLRLGAGAHVWFLKGPERWEAWTEDELAKQLAPDEPDRPEEPEEPGG